MSAFNENLHSGYSGIVPDPFHIAMKLVNRLVDFHSHKVADPFHVDIPEHRKQECEVAARMLPSMIKMLPVKDGLHSIAHGKETENYELVLNSTWLP